MQPRYGGGQAVRILYDYQIFSHQFYGGVSRYFVELARRLARREDTSVRILAPLHINRYLQELNPEIVSGRRIAWTPKAAGKILNIYNKIASRYCAGAFKPDILHETYFTNTSIIPAGNQLRVVTVYDMIHERFPEFFPSRDNTAINKRRAVERSDHVLCISEKTRQDLLEAVDVSADNVSVVPLSFDIPQINDVSDERLLETPYLLYVGSRYGYKNFSRLLDAYAGNGRLSTEFRLVCFGDNKFSQTELLQAEKSGLANDRLVWMGGNDATLMQLYRHASAFVYPSLYEGFGIPPLEAMANGCPVVCSTGGSIPEVVGDAGEFFDPTDSVDMARAIDNVVASPQRTAELRAAGRRRIGDFSWEKCATATHAIYSRLC